MKIKCILLTEIILMFAQINAMELPEKKIYDFRQQDKYQFLSSDKRILIDGIKELEPQKVSLGLALLLTKEPNFVESFSKKIGQKKFDELREIGILRNLALQAKKDSIMPFLENVAYTAEQQYRDVSNEEKRNTSVAAIQIWKDYINCGRNSYRYGLIGGVVGLSSIFIAPAFPLAAPFLLYSGGAVEYYQLLKLISNVSPFPDDPAVYYPARTKRASENWQMIQGFNESSFQ